MFDLVTAEELKESLRASGRRGLALDIDDTLSQTGWYCIEQLVRVHGNPGDLTSQELREQYAKLLTGTSAWPAETVAATHWHVVHSNEVQEGIPLIEYADEAVRSIDALVPVVAYVTARPVAVYEGTRNWLMRHRFPEASVVFRPPAIGVAERSAWKAKVLANLYPEVQGVVDDHAELAGQLAGLGYAGKVYLYDNGHCASDYAGMSDCGSWEDILEFVRRDFAVTVN